MATLRKSKSTLNKSKSTQYAIMDIDEIAKDMLGGTVDTLSSVSVKLVEATCEGLDVLTNSGKLLNGALTTKIAIQVATQKMEINIATDNAVTKAFMKKNSHTTDLSEEELANLAIFKAEMLK